MPAGPERLPLRDWIAATKRALKEFVADDCMGLAQQIAYNSLLAFFPAVGIAANASGQRAIAQSVSNAPPTPARSAIAVPSGPPKTMRRKASR